MRTRYAAAALLLFGLLSACSRNDSAPVSGESDDAWRGRMHDKLSSECRGSLTAMAAEEGSELTSSDIDKLCSCNERAFFESGSVDKLRRIEAKGAEELKRQYKPGLLRCMKQHL